MINYDNGKKIGTLGFGLTVLTVLGSLGIQLLYIVGMGPPMWLYSFISIVSMLASVLIAGGFGMMWLSDRSILDLGIVGIEVIGLIYSLVINGLLKMYSPMLNLLMSLVFSLLCALLALRVRNTNRMLFLLLGAAFVFRAAVPILQQIVFDGGLPMMLSLIVPVVNVVINGLCVLATMQEVRGY